MLHSHLAETDFFVVYAWSPPGRNWHFYGQTMAENAKIQIFLATGVKIDQKSQQKSITAVAARHRPVSRP